MARCSLFIGIPLVLVTVVACGRVDPYIYAPEATSRTNANFGKPLKDRGEVTICYNRYRTDPAEVSAMAVAECGRFGRRALFSKSTFTRCPLIAPYAAIYTCSNEDPVSVSTGGKAGANTEFKPQ